MPLKNHAPKAGFRKAVLDQQQAEGLTAFFFPYTGKFLIMRPGTRSWQPTRVESGYIIQNGALNLVHSTKSSIIPVKVFGRVVDSRGQLEWEEPAG